MKDQNRADAITMDTTTIYSPYMMLNICIINHDSCPVLFRSVMAHNKEHTFVQTCQLHVDLEALEECLNVAFICALLTLNTVVTKSPRSHWKSVWRSSHYLWHHNPHQVTEFKLDWDRKRKRRWGNDWHVKRRWYRWR